MISIDSLETSNEETKHPNKSSAISPEKRARWMPRCSSRS